MKSDPVQPLEILLVEDSASDAQLCKLALAECSGPSNLHIVRDGEAAMRFLHRESEHAAAPRPDLVLLDLNLPLKDGRDVLREVKGDPGLQEIPIVVFSTSRSSVDVEFTYRHGANSYVPKPMTLEEYMKAVCGIHEYWGGANLLPTKD